MNPNIGQGFQNPLEHREGELFTTDALSLSLSDEEVAFTVGNRLDKAERFWEKELNLTTIRSSNDKYWLNDSVDESELYGWQVPYKDPRIFIAIESLIPMAISRPPMPLITEGSDTDVSRELGRKLQDVLLGKYEDLYLKSKFIMIARHLLVGYRLGVMKYSWDNTIGQLQTDGTRFGDVAASFIRPQRIVVAEAADDQDNVSVIGEYKNKTVEELVFMFPDKKDDIRKYVGMPLIGSTTTKMIGYTEAWFTYHTKDGKPEEGLCWKIGKQVYLGGKKNPYWNYSEIGRDKDGNAVPNNFFDKPKKPYVFFSFLNLGKYIIDDTSLTEQASNQQDIVNKRGRQIVENADAANSGMIYNSDMISPESVAKLLGNPREKAMVKGNVNDAAARLAPNVLPDYVIMDKQDARSEVDNVFATHGAIKGEVTKSKTLGQDVLSQRGDISRIMTLSTAIEDGADRLYKGFVQLMKVFYDTPLDFNFSSPEGKTTFVNGFSQDGIEKNIKIRVKTGSMVPNDPVTRQEKTFKAMAILDPLTIGEGLDEENPKEFAERVMLYRLAPDKYMTKFLGIDPMDSGTDPSAEQEIQIMNSGQEVPPQPTPSKAHIATHQAFMESPDFKSLPPEIQNLHLNHIKAEVANLKQQLGGNPQQQEAQPEPNGQIPGQQPGQPPAQGAQQPPPQGGGGIMSKLVGMFRGNPKGGEVTNAQS